MIGRGGAEDRRDLASDQYALLALGTGEARRRHASTRARSSRRSVFARRIRAAYMGTKS